jgi:hypothetical protein
VGIVLAGTKPGGRSTAANSAPSDRLAVNPDSKDKSTGVPKHITSGLFFGEIMALKKKVSERERQGASRASQYGWNSHKTSLSSVSDFVDSQPSWVDFRAAQSAE